MFQSKFSQVRSRKEAITTYIKFTPDPPFFVASVIAKNIPKQNFIYFSLVDSLIPLFSFIFVPVIHYYYHPSGIDLNKICKAVILFHSVALMLFMDGLDLALEYGAILISLS